MIGTSRAALSAGKKPKITPTAAEDRKAMTTMPALKTNGTRNISVSSSFLFNKEQGELRKGALWQINKTFIFTLAEEG
jgi:hypothetical protein